MRDIRIPVLAIVVVFSSIAFWKFGLPRDGNEYQEYQAPPTPPREPAESVLGPLPSRDPIRSTMRTFSPTIDLPASFDGQTIVAKTNLPDNTNLSAALLPPVPACRPNCRYIWSAALVVKNGQFTLGPFGARPGSYTLEIYSGLSQLQPADVQSVFGVHGENLAGPNLAAEVVPGAGPTISYTAQITISAPAEELPSAVPDEELPSIGWCARQGDPYSKEQCASATARYEVARKGFLDTTFMLHYALSCKVFAMEVEIVPLFVSEQCALTRQMRNDYVTDPKLYDMMVQSRQKGLNMASTPNNCDFWRDHPDALYEIRRAASSAVSPRRC